MMLWAMMALLAQAPAQDANECDAGPAQVMIGERYRRHVPTRAKRLTGSRQVRVIWPGQVMTDDFRVDRVDLRVDHQRRIADVSCG